ncbi:MAG: hypothetical protein KBS94_07190 [Prevotella sp.]|nr:hypothetical protein [Candidatus Equicola faecalis]
MRKISKNDFLAKLGKVKSAESVKQHVVYLSIHLEGSNCKGIRESSGHGFEIDVDKLYLAYYELDIINTTELKKHIKNRVQSPALAILIEMGLA